MTQIMPSSYRFDPADPRAPTAEEWDRMTPEERARIVEMLPVQVPEELMPPEGDPHYLSKTRPRLALDSFFRRTGRRVYVSGEMNVYYPGERLFAPDLYAVLDVEIHERKRWVVSREGKGLDLVLEVHCDGDRDKDYRLNVERYARLGIAEYFIFDCQELRLTAYRLPVAPAGRARVYKPIVPQLGRYASEVLGLDVMIEGARLRFLFDDEPVLEAEELVTRLTTRVDDLVARHRATEQRAEDAEQRAKEAEQRAQNAERRAEDAERELAAARAELARLEADRRGG